MKIVRYGIAAAAALTFTSAWAGDKPQAAKDACTEVAVAEMHGSDAKPAQADGASSTAETAGSGGDARGADADRPSVNPRYTVGIEAPDPEHVAASSLATSP